MSLQLTLLIHSAESDDEELAAHHTVSSSSPFICVSLWLDSSDKEPIRDWNARPRDVNRRPEIWVSV